MKNIEIREKNWIKNFSWTESYKKCDVRYCNNFLRARKSLIFLDFFLFFLLDILNGLDLFTLIKRKYFYYLFKQYTCHYFSLGDYQIGL